MADCAFSARGAARPPKTPPSRPGHDVLFRAWITTTRHLAGSARSPQSSSCSRWRLSEGCSTVPPGRAATATPSPPTARRPQRHRRRSAVRSVGESRSGRCAGSFASSHNWLQRGQSPDNAVGHRRTAGVTPCASSRVTACGDAGARVRAVRFDATRVLERTASPARYRDARSRSLAAQRSARQIACVGCATCAAPGNPALSAIQGARVDDRPVRVGASPCWDPAVSGRYT